MGDKKAESTSSSLLGNHYVLTESCYKEFRVDIFAIGGTSDDPRLITAHISWLLFRFSTLA